MAYPARVIFALNIFLACAPGSNAFINGCKPGQRSRQSAAGVHGCAACTHKPPAARASTHVTVPPRVSGQTPVSLSPRLISRISCHPGARVGERILSGLCLLAAVGAVLLLPPLLPSLPGRDGSEEIFGGGPPPPLLLSGHRDASHRATALSSLLYLMKKCVTTS